MYTNNIAKVLKKNISSILIPLVIVCLIYLFCHPLYVFIDEENFAIAHLIVEFFIVTVSATIALQAWMIFPHTLSNQRLLLGSIFFTLALLEIGHAISYKGMPLFILESSAYQATWFYVANRLILAICLLAMVLTPEKKVPTQRRWLAYGLGLTFALLWCILLYAPVKLLPDLVIEGSGTTALKNSLQFFALFLQLVVILLILLKDKQGNFFHRMILIASVYIIFSDLMYTMYSSVYAFENFMGHVFQVIGFYFLLKALYYTSVEEPFQRQKEAEAEQQKHKEVIEYMAYYDELTGLPNKRYFQEQVKGKLNLAVNEKMAVLVIDIDRFEVINETLGYSFGDRLLMALSRELSTVLPVTMSLSRFYGEQFTLLVPSVENDDQLEDVCLLIQEALKKPLQVENIDLRVFVNIGIAVYPEHGQNVDELLQHANIAMYKAKQKNKKYQIYDTSMNEELLERLVLENDLHQALKNQEFKLVYQPQIDIETKQIFSLEALLRWEHPTRGLIFPAQFISIAEKTGLIVPIGEWVLRTACQQLKLCHDQGLEHLGIAVNLSARQFYQDNLVGMVADILAEHRLKPACLELEITESMTMMNMQHSLEILKQLKALGVRIAIDDFGTGYSSLNYLNKLPFDRLKIDRSFFQNVMNKNQNTAIIVSLIISMARHLKMDVIAEGVENLDQVNFLIDKNCLRMQGYLFSKPLEAATLMVEMDDVLARIKSKSILMTS